MSAAASDSERRRAPRRGAVAESTRGGGAPDLTAVSRRIISWYRREGRALPWRASRDPYAIWISEVMLQQTRVAAALPYYEGFIDRFPGVEALAAAAADEVLQAWAGLGYYSRGRNLHRAARRIVAEHGGVFPRCAGAIRSLPGIGEYTAAAVGSIAFGHPRPPLDGNVERVLCRYLALDGDATRGETRRRIRRAAAEALDGLRPGLHNQAMMELGALICVPRNPLCESCPLSRSCRGRRLGDPERFPRAHRERRPEEQHWVAAVVTVGERVLVVRSPIDAELLPDQWGVPLARRRRDGAPSPAAARRAARARARALFGNLERGSRSAAVVRHSITWRRLSIHPVRLSATAGPGVEVRLLDPAEANTLPALHRKVITRALGG
ncbi:MAG: A/G-specific adenine glycosylase [Planctomycetota bacterium]